MIEYYEYRDSSGMPNILDEDVKGKVKSYKKEFPEYVEETVKGYIADTLATVLPAGAKVVLDSGGGTAIDVALEAAKFGVGWDKQKKENAEIDAVIRKDYEGEEMEAYQRSGQVLYVNGVRVVNNESTDKSRLDELMAGFKEQFDEEENECYREFFPKGCDQVTRDAIEAGLHDSESVEYKNAFIKWYTEGIGDSGHKMGREYPLKEEKK